MTSLDQIIQYFAWIIALFELIVGLYILVLNIQHSSNRHVSAFLMLLAVNTFAVGAVLGASNAGEAMIPTLLLAATITAVQPGLLIASIVLLRPAWLQQSPTGVWRWIRWLPYILGLLPLSLTIIDLVAGAGLWFTGLDPNIYQGGYAELGEYANGSLHNIVVVVNLYLTGTIALIFLLSHSFDFRRILPLKQAGQTSPADKETIERTFGLARMLFLANLLGAVSTSLLNRLMPPAASYLVVSTVFVITYAYSAFRQMISERRMQRGSLQARLTALVLIITLPLTIALTVFLGSRAQKQIQVDALNRLETASHSITDSTDIWLQYNLKALEQFVASDIAINMDAQEQKAYLEAMTATYPEMYLISTTDLNGLNVARSDDADNTDYSDRAWFQGARDGNPVTYQTLIGRTSGQPALVVSMPIRDPQGEIVGVGMFASDLDEVSHLVEHSPIGEAAGQEGIAFVVDAQNRAIAHPDKTVTAELSDFSQYPPVVALNRGETGLVLFEEEDSVGAGSDKWYAYISHLDNGWGAVTQQKESVLLAPARAFQAVSLVGALLGAGLLFVLTIFTIRQGILPVLALTETARAITEGDLTRTAPVDSEDELGMLARSFNTMTSQLSELITGLEARVSERTNDLERRALQLQVAAEVAREAAGIRDLEQLLTHAVNLISDRFGFYHAGIFLLTEDVLLVESRLAGSPGTVRKSIAGTSGYAALRAASSAGGQRMLARQHRLKVGQVGIVGYVAASGQPRIALDVGQDAVYFDNPDLPDTRSEMGLPLIIQDRVIGVLDVQSTQPSAFTEEDLAILQILADQIALAIEDARLLRESQQALADVEALYGAQVHTSWQKQLEGSKRAYHWDAATNLPRLATDVKASSDGISQNVAGPNGNDGQQAGEPASAEGELLTINIPIELRGQRLGNLVFKRQNDQGDWSPEEREILNETLGQVALALESARLLQEAQRLAVREQQINLIASQVSASVNIETILQSTVRELGKALGASRTTIQIGDAPQSDYSKSDDPGNGAPTTAD